MTVSALNWLLVPVGAKPSYRRLHKLPRDVLCFVDLFCFIYTAYLFIYCLLFRRTYQDGNFAQFFALDCDIVFCTVVYLWGLRWAARIDKEQRCKQTAEPLLAIGRYEKDPSLWANIIISAIVILLVTIETTKSIEYPSFDHDYAYAVSIFVHAFLYGVIMKVHCYAIYFAIALRMTEVSKDIEALTRNLDATNVHDRCRYALKTHIQLNQELGWFLRVVHFFYALKLLIDAPGQSASMSCGNSIYILLTFASNLQVLLIILSRGDRLSGSFNALKAKVRKEMVLRRSYELEVFYRSEFGIFVGINSGGCINWSNTCAFLGVAWSFAFIVLQSATQFLPAECE